MPTIPELVDPVDREYRRQRIRRWAYAGIVVYLLALWIYWGIIAEVPVDYRDDAEHFKYGSIGADSYGGIPYWIWRVLPELFPEYLPDPESVLAQPPAQRDGLTAYAQFGYVLESGRDTPIGFSKRRDLVTRVGLNCAACHTSTVRIDEEQARRNIYGTTPNVAAGSKDRVIVLGMPAQTVDLQRYFQFLFRCADDERFTVENIMSQIAARTKLGLIDSFLYRQAIPNVRAMLITRRQQLNYFALVPHFGPGRVDTFTPYKRIQFRFEYDGTVGAADFPSLWNQRPREGMHLHWDGNNQSVFERNISASIGAGATPVSLDMHRMLRVARWIGSPEPDPDKAYTAAVLNEARQTTVPRSNELPIPKYPFAIDGHLASVGRAVYERHCASCHDWNGKYVGLIEPWDRIQTDRSRLDSYTLELNLNQNTLGAEHWWRFRNFRKTSGYANMPLDGLWARAPYLHNGSVPTLRDLLQKTEMRPQKFFRGDDIYDTANVGFQSHIQKAESGVTALKSDGRVLFLFDTSERGNGASGHEYGTDLPVDEKNALIEYLKTL